MNTELYYHETDGGAEYLCASPIEGTNEGDMRTTVVRLDGQPEFTKPVYAAAPELLEALKGYERMTQAILAADELDVADLKTALAFILPATQATIASATP